MLRIYHHDDCLTHDPGPQHPESPGRLHAIMQSLRSAPFQAELEYTEAPLGTEAQILLAHSGQHLQDVQASAPTTGRVALDPDTILSPGSLSAALRGTGAACAGVDDLVNQACSQVFCLTRPPGHHATPTHAMGFCIFNQIAIAALYAQSSYSLSRVAIVDFDVHHGNGTQDIVSGRPDLLYLSTHQSPHYPGTGTVRDNRPGNIHNVPLLSGTDDAAYRQIFSSEILPALAAFQPELLLVSAGFDAHVRDPLASLALDESTYAWLGRELKQVADTHAKGRLLSVLEGGYNLDVLGPSVVAYLGGALL